MYTYEDLLEIVKTLRSPQGCPWDREQTHKSLKPCLMEEAAETVAAIRIFDKTGSYDNLVEELGDVLLQVVMHAQIAGEEGLFTINEVIDNVASKMVRRHPHVFGETQVSGTGQVLDNWEAIKKAEKEGKSYIESPLKEIPPELPALTRAPKVLKKTDKLYEAQPSYEEAVRALQESAARLSEYDPDSDGADIAKSAGDALMALSQAARICRLPQEQLLNDRIEDIIDKYEPGKA